MWADQVEPEALDQMLAAYEDELHEHILILREQARRSSLNPQTRGFADRIAEHWIAFYELELEWVRGLRHEILQ